jgi:hypothetical protein
MWEGEVLFGQFVPTFRAEEERIMRDDMLKRKLITSLPAVSTITLSLSH